MKRKNLWRVNFLVVHCAATPPSLDVGATEIDRWHRDRGFLGIGYHFVIRRDGTAEPGRPLHEMGAHVRGWNNKSIGICLVGGVDEDKQPAMNFEQAQLETLKMLLENVPQVLGAAGVQTKDVGVLGHRDFPGVHKACPSFDVREWLGLEPWRW